MKKVSLFILLCCFIVCLGFCFGSNFLHVYAADNQLSQEEIEDMLENGVNDQLGKIDLSELDKIINSFTSDQQGLFGSNSFLGKVKMLLTGELGENYNSIFSVLLSIIFDGCLKYLPLLASIVAVAVLSSIFNGTSSAHNKGIGEVVHFVCYGIIVILLTTMCVGIIKSVTNVLSLIRSQSEIIFPVLLTLIAAMGGSVSVKLFQPIVLIISNIILNVVYSILVPMLILVFIFTILGNLTKAIKFEKFALFLTSSFKWVLGFVFTIFSAFLGVKGIMASTFDGISIKTAKYAVKSYVPILGGYLSEGFDIILTSSLLIKNAVGAAGILMLLSTIAIPIVNLVVFNLFLKLSAAICEPICDSRISNFLYGISKIIPYLIACIFACAFMYLLTLGFAMLTASTIL